MTNGVDYQKLYMDLNEEFQQAKGSFDAIAAQLKEELAKASAEASGLRQQANREAAAFEFERKRAERLAAQLNEFSQHLKAHNEASQRQQVNHTAQCVL